MQKVAHSWAHSRLILIRSQLLIPALLPLFRAETSDGPERCFPFSEKTPEESDDCETPLQDRLILHFLSRFNQEMYPFPTPIHTSGQE